MIELLVASKWRPKSKRHSILSDELTNKRFILIDQLVIMKSKVSTNQITPT